MFSKVKKDTTVSVYSDSELEIDMVYPLQDFPISRK